MSGESYSHETTAAISEHAARITRNLFIKLGLGGFRLLINNQNLILRFKKHCKISIFPRTHKQDIPDFAYPEAAYSALGNVNMNSSPPAAPIRTEMAPR